MPGGAGGAAGAGRAARLGAERLVVHFSTRGGDGRWAVELRTPGAPGPGGRKGATRARAGGPDGAVVRLPGGGHLVLEEPLDPAGTRLWWARMDGGDVPGLLGRHGRPIRYGYTERDQPLSAYQTVFALPSPDSTGSAEMPSAGRPFTARLVAELVSRGVQFAPIRLDTGVASAEAHQPPYPERFEVPATTARLVNAAVAGGCLVDQAGSGSGVWCRGSQGGGGSRRGASATDDNAARCGTRDREPGKIHKTGPGGGRIVAVGTTAVRALESAAGPRGGVRAASGWTDLVVTPRRGVRVVDGLLTGLHEPAASHLLMLEAITGREALEAAYTEAVRHLYLWHEFGDVHLVLPDENAHSPSCASNLW
ncbi:S-adenosylmethionine:tRNA ribosyltransferase-isomerase [Streptomyces sp. NBC_01716]|uniref:S-adenosylmethionine:tRNA ribosyltransferase-isomerase n=1 Tax=Streptomyces sp. NBC_01716 TaxID=2975917 RepID=UPI002E305656|nr:S-adenosylmethionine:tRNA ribosyltransferase-isomerase [Streptomyces sp. NBC_01716]